MFRNTESRDHFDATSTAARNAENTELPGWLRSAWAQVARGEARSVSEALERRDGRRSKPEARDYGADHARNVAMRKQLAAKHEGPPVSAAERWEALYSRKREAL